MKVLFLCPALFFAAGIQAQPTEVEMDAAHGEQSASAEAMNTLLSGVATLELFSLDPRAPLSNHAGEESEHLFGWKKIGKAVVTDADTIERLTRSLIFGIRENDGTSDSHFSPRQAIRFRKDQGEITLVISFECMHGYCYGTPKIHEFRTTYFPGAVFGEVFSRLGLRRIEEQDCERRPGKC